MGIINSYNSDKEFFLPPEKKLHTITPEERTAFAKLEQRRQGQIREFRTGISQANLSHKPFIRESLAIDHDHEIERFSYDPEAQHISMSLHTPRQDQVLYAVRRSKEPEEWLPIELNNSSLKDTGGYIDSYQRDENAEFILPELSQKKSNEGFGRRVFRSAQEATTAFLDRFYTQSLPTLKLN